MGASTSSRISIGGGFLLVVLLGVLMIMTGGAAAQSADTVVATDGSGDYTSIQSAVDNATEGDRIKVEPGTYEQHTEVNKNVTVYAPNGATVANTSAVASKYGRFDARSGFQIYGDVTPTISGFTLTDWQWAISAGGSEGAWTLKDTEIIGGDCGVCAAGTPGDWTVKNTDISDAGTISGYESTGDWEITDTTVSGTDISADKSTGNPTVRNTSLLDTPADGISIEESTGSLTISDSTLENTTYAAIEAENTSADITVSDTVITEANTGIDFEEGSTGDLELIATSITGITYDAIDVQRASGTITIENTTVRTADNGIDAEKSDGQLEVRNFTVTDTTGDGIDASNATGDATVRESAFREMGDKSIDVIDSAGKWEVHESILTGGTEGGVDAWDAEFTVNASYNYWGAADGPSGQFNGSGSEAGGNIIITPYYTESSLTVPKDGSKSLSVALSPTEVTTTETADITVSVTDASGSPVSEAAVTIPAFEASTTAVNGDATLSITPEKAGSYDVVAAAEGYTNATTTLTVKAGTTGDHESGVSQELFDAVDQDGDDVLSRGETRGVVEQFIRTGEIDGVPIARDDVRSLVKYLIRQ